MDRSSVRRGARTVKPLVARRTTLAAAHDTAKIRPDAAHAHPRRSASQSQHTSPCQRCASRMYGEVGGTGWAADIRKYPVTSAITMSTASGCHVPGQRQLGEHGVDVDPVAPGPDHQEDGVQPGGSDAPASSSRTAAPGRRRRAAGCRRGRRCGRRVAPAVTSRNRAASAAASSTRSANPGRSGPAARTWSQYAGQSANSSAKVAVVSPSGGGVRSAASRSVIAAQAVRSAGRHGRRGWRASTCSMPSTTQSSASCSHSSRGAGAAGGRTASLRASSAYASREHPLGLARCGLHEVTRAVSAGEDRGEAGSEAGTLGDRLDHRRPAVPLDHGPDVRRQVRPLQTPSGAAVRDRRRDHAATLACFDRVRGGGSTPARVGE